MPTTFLLALRIFRPSYCPDHRENLISLQEFILWLCKVEKIYENRLDSIPTPSSIDLYFLLKSQQKMKIGIFMDLKNKIVLNDGELVSSQKLGLLSKNRIFKKVSVFCISSVSSRKRDCLPIQCNSNFKPIILKPF